MRQKIKIIILSILSVVFIFTLTSCEENILKSQYTGYLAEEEVPMSYGMDVTLDEYKSFRFTTSEDAKIESETIFLIEFYFYTEDIQNITLSFKWMYYTTFFNIERTVELGGMTFITSGEVNKPTLVSLELNPDNYFVIKNNKTQYLIIDIEAPEGFKCFMQMPDIYLVTDDDESKLEDEFDEEPEGDE
ncbi:MAG: hypothetical protein IJS58_08955 [Bacilli bacterium]|nr:hypothetical protein [Bacilli bacterium]